MPYRIHCPISWDLQRVKRLAEMGPSHGIEIMLYGALPRSFPTGRPNDVPHASREDAVVAFRCAEEHGARTKYLLNGVSDVCDIHGDVDYVRWVATELAPDVICVSSRSVANSLVSSHDCRNLAVSTIAGWRQPGDADPWLNDDQLRDRLCAVSMHHDFALVSSEVAISFVRELKDRGIEPDVLVSESCSEGCPVRQQHYSFFGQHAHTQWTRDFVDPFQRSCVLGRLLRPDTLLDLAGFLPPSRLDAFSDCTGITGFKLSGRSMRAEWVLNSLDHYVRRQDPRNMFEIIVFTTPAIQTISMTSADLFFLAADAYLELFDQVLCRPGDPGHRRQRQREAAVRFFNEGRLRICDPDSVYAVQNGRLKCVKPGEYASRLQESLRPSLSREPATAAVRAE